MIITDLSNTIKKLWVVILESTYNYIHFFNCNIVALHLAIVNQLYLFFIR